jgi:hypothetical protein
MNSYKLNGIAGHHFRMAVCKKLGINHTEIYKEVKHIDNNGIIITKDDRKFELTLKQIDNETD